MIVSHSLSWRRVVAAIGRPVAAHVVIAAGVAVAHHYSDAAWLSVPALPVTILASTIGILLAFRNNSGYDRWWEARTLWGGIVNHSRTFARQTLTFLPSTLPTPSSASTGDAMRGRADDANRPPEFEHDSPNAALVQRQIAQLIPPVVGAGVSATAVTSALDAQQAGDAAPASVTYDLTLTSDGAVRDREGRASDTREFAIPADHGPPSAHSSDKSGSAVDAGSDAERARRAWLASHPGVTREFDAVSAEARELIYAQIAFVNATRCHLRRQDPFAQISPFVRPALLDALHTEQNVPVAILLWMAARLRRIFAGHRSGDAFHLVALDETLTELTNLLGGCERIKNTPIPRQYDWLPRVAARAYLVLLPLSVVQELGLLTPLVTAVVAFLFLALDMIGRNVEAPFENDIHDTPMTALCRTIEINLRQMLGETELPPPVQPVDGVLL